MTSAATERGGGGIIRKKRRAAATLAAAASAGLVGCAAALALLRDGGGGGGGPPSRSLAAAVAGGGGSIGAETTMLLGIFSTASEKDGRRRSLIRDTYLSAYKGDRRVCGWAEYVRRGSKDKTRGGCRLAYAFVVGANDDGPTDHDDDGSPLTVDPKHPHGEVEDDVVYLNIRENMEDGKSPTWFKYGASVSEPHGIDYVAKTDSDSYVNLGELLLVMERDLPPAPNNRRMYGGRPWANFRGDGLYMAGQFYFVSSDLAWYVGYELGINRKARLRKGTEDMDFGSYVFSNPRPVKMVMMDKAMFWFHPIKEEGKWRDFAKKHKGGGLPRWTPKMPFKALTAMWLKHGSCDN